MVKDKTKMMHHFDKMHQIFLKNGSVIGSIDPPPSKEEIDYANKLNFLHEILPGPRLEEGTTHIDVFSK